MLRIVQDARRAAIYKAPGTRNEKLARWHRQNPGSSVRLRRAASAGVGADLALATAAGTTGATGNAKATGSKATALTQGKAATTAAADGTTETANPSATATATAVNGAPQPTVEAKANAASAVGDAIKPDGNAVSAVSASTTREHASVAANAQAQAGLTDPSAQAQATQQQLATATVTSADKFTVTPATGAAVPLSGLAVEIAASVQSGKTRFEVRLDPADLGRIDVRIDVDRNGQVTSHLTVEKPETLTMLQQDAPQLQQALNDAGLKTGSGGLQFSLRDQSSSGQNHHNQSGAQPQRLVITEEDTVPATIAGRSYGRTLGASGGVDIKV
jgi:flagellar hook-length control protein FliK